MLARSFAPLFERDESVVVFASGVSDSQCSVEAEYSREATLLRESIETCANARLFLYFSTCSIFDPSARDSRYVKHKLQMEELVSRHGSHLVLRLPVVVGPTANATSLVRHLADRMRAGQSVEVWKNAGRYLIDVDDVVAIGVDLIETELARNERINVAGPKDTPLPELVETLGRVIGKQPVCRCVKRGSRYTFDTERIEASVARQGIRFDCSYLERTLRKYYGSNTTS